ncbi:GNAT family N-acetyltransferase [Rossellomorea aquimaris]|uniref:Phosphinothricin acetyltransferase n=1 Tax=Rossellomorea aquimaris TaxID=189382 RepID=A0A1J6WXN4_9BACI|nr:GNAT family N-acetyltransferase [Rossellomorea aquimaris]OIU70649.1 phosphinothricin acetyltransferase [Rossellomorea aquimaris]
MKRLFIEEMKAEDWEAVKEIYLEGIATGNATFQKEAPSWEQWDKGHAKEGRIVARTADCLQGWAALSPVSGRCVYAGVAEVSVYVSTQYQGKGTGSLLLDALIEVSESHGYWTLQAGIFPENVSSIRLHEKHGFRVVGRREKIGKMDGIWRDTLLLERRSKAVGVS